MVGPVATQFGITHMGTPDICNTPTPAGPVPTPYVAIGMKATGVPPVPNVLINCGPIQDLGTIQPIVNGDNAGVALGVASGTVMGPSQKLTGSATVFAPLPVTTIGDLAIANSTNVPAFDTGDTNFIVTCLS